MAPLMVVCIPGRFAFSARGAILGHSCVFDYMSDNVFNAKSLYQSQKFRARL